MKTSTKILIFLLAVSLVANGGLLYKYCDMKNQVEAGYDTMDNVYQQNLGLLSTHCTDLENGLSKILVSNQTERIASLLKDAVRTPAPRLQLCPACRFTLIMWQNSTDASISFQTTADIF